MQIIPKPHPSKSCQSHTCRFCEYPGKKKLHNYSDGVQKNAGCNVPVDSASPQIPNKPLRLCSQRCSVRSAHSAQESKARISPSRCKRCQRVSPDSQIFKYPPFCEPLILVVARFEMQHDAVVNHVYMSKQLCQAESECPLLVRERFRSSSSVASRSRSCFGGMILRNGTKHRSESKKIM